MRFYSTYIQLTKRTATPAAPLAAYINELSIHIFITLLTIRALHTRLFKFVLISVACIKRKRSVLCASESDSYDYVIFEKRSFEID